MPVQIPITLACGDYDRTRAIKDGRVPIEGCAVTYLPMEPEEVFHRAFKHQEFDVCELSFSSYLRTVDAGTSPLKGKLIGLPEYQITAVVWLRGLMQDEYGVRPTDIRWRQGGIEQPGRSERTPLKPIPVLELRPIPPDKTLSGMLEAGELDAMFSARAPSCFTRGAPHVARLFPNYREVEKAYYKKTGMFPMMHLIGVKRDLVEKYPWLPASLYKAFVQAKTYAMREVHDVNALAVTLPWLVAEAEETAQLMGADFWRYGVNENAKEIDALTRYAYEQGLVTRKLTIEELFPHSVIEVSKV